MIKVYKKGSNQKLSEHFSTKEFDCHCRSKNCTFTYIDTDLINYLGSKRSEFGKPIKIISGFRCAYWNQKQGGKKGSYHLIGKAADISWMDGKNILKDAQAFEDADGLGRYPKNKFIHVDVRGYKARWIYK